MFLIFKIILKPIIICQKLFLEQKDCYDILHEFWYRYFLKKKKEAQQGQSQWLIQANPQPCCTGSPMCAGSACCTSDSVLCYGMGKPWRMVQVLEPLPYVGDTEAPSF